MTINEQYQLAKKSKFGEEVDIKSHMAKNSEWGATAYLAHSKYGTNGQEIEKNTNSDYYTGGSNNKAIIYTNNKMQTTTGNATGVYDMNSNICQYLSSYVNIKGSSRIAEFGGTLSGDLYGANDTERKTSTEYKMVYESSGVRATDYEMTKKNKGDTIYEVSNNYNNDNGSWFWNRAYFPDVGSPFFCRLNSIGLACCVRGKDDITASFRMVLISQ